MPQFPPDLSDLSLDDWQNRLFAVGSERGFAEQLDPRHSAVFVENGDVLLVSFENQNALTAVSQTNTPFGLDIAADQNWSSLSMLSRGDTWFRASSVYAFFDKISDDGLLDRFSQVIFFGNGPAAYAACAYSVAAPGCKVLALQPQATLDPRYSGWDDRFLEQRAMNFSARYGYAPDMLEAAKRAYVLFDPRQRLDAMHAALFRRQNVTRYELPFQGPALQIELQQMGLLGPLLRAVVDDTLEATDFAAMIRPARREHFPYLRRVISYLEQTERTEMAYNLCAYVAAKDNAIWFQRKLTKLTQDNKTPEELTGKSEAS